MAGRNRTLVLEAEVSGRSFSFEDQELALVGDDPEIITAYFAEKKNEYVEKDHEDPFTFKFSDDNNDLTNKDDDLVDDAKRRKLASYIYGKVKADGDKKYTTNTKVYDALTEASYKTDDEITITTYKKEKKEYYSKITTAPMGYQVYLVAETKKLDSKTLKIKILESKSQNQEKTNVFKLVKTETDKLPVLVFAKLEDKTTTTEAGDWIEIDIKKQDQKILGKTEGTEIEVGIKKIQLRPKEDKIASEKEDAIKSFEGWQEALYIREDETVAGKKAIKNEENEKTTRDAETFTNLTFDKNATEISKPASIKGPKNVEIGKVAVYTIDTYKKNGTKADKNNIRWSIWINGDKKTVYKTIDAKSKPGFYTYAKTELDGDNNKLTIIFEKALKDKKIQIEPYREDAPKIDQSKVSHDFIKTTTIKEADAALSKIAIRDKARLYLKIEGDDIKSTEEERANGILESATFKLDAKPFWTNPIKNPEITLYNFSAAYKPKGSCFGNVRLKYKNKKLVPKPHTGLDIFAEKGTDLFAALDGEVERIYGKSDDNSYGNVVVIEVESVEYLKKSKNKYILKYAKEIEKGPDFNLKGKIYLRYAHVQKILVKVGDKVKSGDKIGLSGVTGNATGTRAPHLHFEIANLPRPGRGLVNRCNPAFYVNHKGETKANKSHQEKISKTSHKI